MKPRVVNLYAGPGTGKSTTCAALFAELKYHGFNVEMILEYAKDATWERRGPKVFQAQDYIFGKQHFRLARVAEEVEITITDAPILLCTAYNPEGYLPSLKQVVYEAYNRYDNLDIFLERSTSKAYNPKGRNQTEEGAKEMDVKIRKVLDDYQIKYIPMVFGRQNVSQIINYMFQRGWIGQPKLEAA